MTPDEIARVRAACTRFATHHPPQSVAHALRALADETPEDLAFDSYGTGDRLAAFEARIAAELGHEAAVFMPSGTMAQQIALRIWSERRGNRTIAFHPLCHLEIHEARAYAFLHRLRALAVGDAARLMTPGDVRALADPVAALLVELPQRELGALLPAWEALEELLAVARERGIAVHLDGARLWEAAPEYGRSHAEIASRFDSVYVSFYKGLGAMAGAMLAGDAGLVARARVWQHRHGGRLVTIAPLALSAAFAFERNVGKMAAYRRRARGLASALRTVAGVSVVPDPPQTNTFHVYLTGDGETLLARSHAIARDRGFLLLRGPLKATTVPAQWRWEFVVGDATTAVPDDEIVAAVREIVAGR